MANFDAAFNKVIIAEGGLKLVNNQLDRGGLTYAGISRRHNPYWEGWNVIDSGDTPSVAQVAEFYKRMFWDRILGDVIKDDDVAYSIFEFAVVAGLQTSIKLAQIVSGAMPDGKFGQNTLRAINSMDAELFSAYFTIAKIARYRDIVTKDRKQLTFFMGWINRALRVVGK